MSARNDDERALLAWAWQLRAEGFGVGLVSAMLLLFAVEVLA
tara:strand:- start:506 stop:631 length:126 start_codon:yes stop_codon:yes gene_type:complete